MNRIQDVIEAALAHSTADACVVIGGESTTSNLRFAANSLTTNGQMTDRSLTMISIIDDEDGRKAGVVTRTVTDDDELAALVSRERTGRARRVPGRRRVRPGRAVPELRRLGRATGCRRHRGVRRLRARAAARRSDGSRRPVSGCTGLPSTSSPRPGSPPRPDCAAASTSPTGGSNSTPSQPI